MLITSPNAVRLGSLSLPDVDRIAIERNAHKIVEEWDDTGPHAVFADVPEQRITLRVERRITRPDAVARPEFVPGFKALFAFAIAPNQSDAELHEFNAICVVASVKYALDDEPARQILTLIAITDNAANDPIAVLSGVRVAGA